MLVIAIHFTLRAQCPLWIEELTQSSILQAVFLGIPDICSSPHYQYMAITPATKYKHKQSAVITKLQDSGSLSNASSKLNCTANLQNKHLSCSHAQWQHLLVAARLENRFSCTEGINTSVVSCWVNRYFSHYTICVLHSKMKAHIGKQRLDHRRMCM